MTITIFKQLRRTWITAGAGSNSITWHELKLCCLVRHHGPVPSTMPDIYIVRERGSSKTNEVLGCVCVCVCVCVYARNIISEGKNEGIM